MAVTKVADIVVPGIFGPYVQQLTEEKSLLVQSGALLRSPDLDAKLAGGGLTFSAPSFRDLGNDAENVSTDNDSSTATPVKIQTSTEVAVRLSRNQVWSGMDLAEELAGADPMMAIADRVSTYWARRLQAAVVATLMGVFADNDAAPAGTEHVRYDLTIDIKGSAYTAGTTDFNAGSFINALTLLGDSASQLTMMMVHSAVYSRMQKNNLITFVPASLGQVAIPTFMGKIVVVDDGLPNPSAAAPATTAAGIFHSWIFGPGAVRWGNGAARVPVEVDRNPLAGTGGGQEFLINRQVWCLHPVGHKYAGTAASGGPSNADTTHNLAHEDSWERVYPERKQIHVARLVTREF